MLSTAMTLAFALASTSHISEAWSMSLPLETQVRVDHSKLFVDNRLTDPRSGFVVSWRSLDMDFSFSNGIGTLPVTVQEGSLAEMLLFSNADWSLYALGSPLQGAFTSFHGLRVRSKAGSKVEDPSALSSQPMYLFGPYKVIGNSASGFFLMTSFSASEDGEDYQAAFLLNPFRVSPLKFIAYYDISQPHRALGRFHPDFNEAAKENWGRRISGWHFGCGDMFTGRLHWKLGDEFTWAGRVGGKILARRASRDPFWHFVNEQTGQSSPVPAVVEERLRLLEAQFTFPPHFASAGNHLLVWGSEVETRRVRLISLGLSSS